MERSGCAAACRKGEAMNAPGKLKLKIEVTQRHINRAEKLRDDGLTAYRCPLALAMKSAVREQFGIRCAPSARYSFVAIRTKWGRYEAEPTLKQLRLMSDFDHGRTVKPVKFPMTLRKVKST